MTASPDDVKAAAREALLQLMEPLTSFVIDAGLSAGDICLLVREAAVRSVAKSQLEISHRANISGIAATTGIPRGEISRILKQKPIQGDRENDRREQSTTRILARWHNNRKFTDINGHPATLKLYGRGVTFEYLVKLYGRGIPARAILDELLRSGAVEVLPGQRIRAKPSLALSLRLSPLLVKRFGDRAADLLSTMLSHLRDPNSLSFFSTVTVSTAPNMLPHVRKELKDKSREFLSELKESLAIAPRKRDSQTVGVTVFYHERKRESVRVRPPENRTNFRRRS